ncbi:MAG: hypothetical protein HY830_02415 [Actinobacteria bacterium]|nr:hypothetical protein [Actinomycetota bacterium]
MTTATTDRGVRNPWVLRGATVLVVLAMAVFGYSQRADARQRPKMPTSATFEGRSGIRVTRVAVVGDGGLVDVRFVVLDPQKAHRYLGDRYNGQDPKADRKAVEAPTLRSGSKHTRLKDVASMHQHADYVAGQSYYLLYLNPAGAIKAGDRLDLEGTAVKENLGALPVS